jgi:hypothetical protein
MSECYFTGGRMFWVWVGLMVTVGRCSLCFYSRTPMTSKAMFALFPDIPEFGTFIVSFRTFRALYNCTVIMVNYCVYIPYVSYIQNYICIRCIYYMYCIGLGRERNLNLHSVSIIKSTRYFGLSLPTFFFSRLVIIKVANNKFH